MEDRRPDRPSAGDTERAAVRSAEQAVSDAWIGELLLAEHEARVTVDYCTRVRDRLAARLRLARQVHDADGSARTRRRLDDAERVCAAATRTYDQTRDLLADQLEQWVHATRKRLRESEADRR